MNSMIPLLGRQAQINDPLETAGNAASLQNLLQVNQMRQRDMDEQDRKRALEKQRMADFKSSHEQAADLVAKMLDAEGAQEGPPATIDPATGRELSIEEQNAQGSVGGAPQVPVTTKRALSVIAMDPRYHYAMGELLQSKGHYADSKQAFEYGRKLEDDRRPAEPKEGSSSQPERAFKVLKAAAIKQQSGQSLTAEEQLDVEAAAAILERQSMMIDPVTQKPMFNQPITIPSSMKPKYGTVSSGKAVNTVPSTSGGRKALDSDTEKKLTKMGESVSQLISIDKMFKPEYVGFGAETVGKAALALDRRTGMGNPDRADWHQRYEQWASDVRAEKFGLSLTGNELENFEKYKVRLSDTPTVAKANVKRQMEIVKNAIRRQRDAVKSSGQNLEQADALIGRDAVKAVEQSAEQDDNRKLTPEEEDALIRKYTE